MTVGTDIAACDPYLRDALLKGFDGRATVRFGEAAKLLNLDDKTLRRHVVCGNISYRVTGTGRFRTRKEFTLTDLVAFYAGRSERLQRHAGQRTRVRNQLMVGMMDFTAMADLPPDGRARSRRGRP